MLSIFSLLRCLFLVRAIPGLLILLWLTPSLADSLQRLEQVVQSFDTLEADFEQVLYDAQSQPLQQSQGSLKLKRPGRFLWRYSEPAVQEIVADGQRIWMYDKDLDQVTVYSQSDRLSGTPLMLLMEASALSSSFDISYLGEADALDWYELIPRAEDSDFDLLFIGLNDTGLAAMELRDNFGQATQIQFSNVRPGVALDDRLFDFEVPEGVDVIGGDEQEQ